jgi:hypothetical protein
VRLGILTAFTTTTTHEWEVKYIQVSGRGVNPIKINLVFDI